MDLERWKRIDLLYHSVVAQPPECRTAALEECCETEPDLRDELESLLNARENAGSFLGSEEWAVHLSRLISEAPAPLNGRCLSHYKVLDEIGAGAMGTVYRALDTRLGRTVALKVLPPEVTHDTDKIRQFQQEARAASALNHLNIITIYDVGEVDGIWFIAAELVDGITLRERLASGRLPTSQALDIALQCVHALCAAHCAGIVHRDVKPENILIRPDNVVKLVDFGLASIATQGSPTHTAAMMGTPRYMSPEQARGQPLDSRTDIFSLGSVLYEMLAGRLAFSGATTVEAIASLLNGTDPPLQDLPRPLRRILQRALSRDRELRYQSAEEFEKDLRKAASGLLFSSRTWRYLAIASALLLASVTTLLFDLNRRSPLTEQDTVLLADFRNKTGDPLFDLTLKQGLAVQLEQSPRFNVFPDARVRETLRLMGHQPDVTITEEVAREICWRQGLKAMVIGSIAPLGNHYVIGLNAIESRDGTTLARAQVEARNKEEVLKALSQGVASLRRKLGESLTSIRKYDALLERTTNSLEALQAYSLGDQEKRRGRREPAIRFFLKAIELDPRFAYAYSDLAVLYRNAKRPNLAAKYASEAYLLRDRVSERERLRITSLYYDYVTGEIEKTIETSKLYAQIYPYDPVPHSNLGTAYTLIGELELAVEESRIAMRLDPDSVIRYSSYAAHLIHLNRYGEAKAVAEEALQRKMDNSALQHALYRIGFATGDRSAIKRYLNWFAGKPNEYAAIARQSADAAFHGQWRQSWSFAGKALEGTKSESADDDARDLRALYASETALRAALLGKCKETRSAVSESLSAVLTPASLPRAALALELCGNAADAQRSELAKLFPKNTIVTAIWLPILRAALEMHRGNDRVALALLRPVIPYEAAAEFWPQYLRGQIYLRLRNDTESAAEFRKILNSRGQSVDSILYPLAYLGLARASALSGDVVQAHKSYEDFLTVWKDADHDLTPLISAQNEYKQFQ